MIKRLLTWTLLLGCAASATAQTLTQGNFTGVLVPQVIPMSRSGSNSKLPVVYMAKLSGLAPNTQYRYYNQLAQRADLGTTAAGAGTMLYSGIQGFTFATLGSTANSTNPIKQYDSLVTNANGEYTGWFFNYTSTNARFRPNNYLFPSIVLDSAGAGVLKRFALNDSIRTIYFDTLSVDSAGTLFWGQSYAPSEQVVVLYGDQLGLTRPFSITLTERLDTQVTSGMPAFYLANVAGKAGAWGAIVPNVNPTGVRGMALFNPNDTAVNPLYGHTDADGVWPITLSTINPWGGLVNPIEMKIGDASLAMVRASFDITSLSVDETDDSTGIITISMPNLNPPLASGFDVVADGGTAIAGSDFNYTTQVLSVAGNGVSPFTVSFKVDLVDDAVSDGPKTIRLAIRNNGNLGMVGADSVLLITINDDEALRVSMKNTQLTLAENAGTAPIQVNIANPSVTDSTEVWVALKGSSNPARVVFTDTIIKFPAGSADSIVINAGIVDDQIYQNSNDTLWFVLRNPTTGAQLNDSIFMVIVTDNDPMPVVGFKTTSSSIAENGGTATVKVYTNATLSTQPIQLRVSWKSGTAVQNTDVLFNDTTISFPALGNPNDSITLSLPIVDNAVYFGNKTFVLAIRNLNGATRGTDSIHTITIVEDEIQLGPELNFAVASQTGFERNPFVPVDVTITGSNSNPTTVQVTISGGTATAADHSYTTTTLTFPANSTTPQRVNIPLVDDTLREAPETIILSMVNPTNSATIGSINQNTITLIDNDNPNFSFLDDKYYVNERRSPFTPALTVDTVRVGVLMQLPVPNTPSSVTVELEVGGSAVLGTDFGFSTQTLTWAAGESGVKNFSFTLPDNNDTNATRNFFLKLTNATNNGVYYQFERMEVFILDDEFSLSVNKSLTEEVVIYPNPAREYVQVRTDRNISAYQLTDAQGKVISTGIVNDNTFRVQLQDLAEGLYLLQLDAEGTKATVKVMVR